MMKLLSACFWSHGDRLRARDERGRLILKCQDCGHEQVVLETEVLKGPKHTPDAVAGQPAGKAVKASWFGKRKVG